LSTSLKPSEFQVTLGLSTLNELLELVGAGSLLEHGQGLILCWLVHGRWLLVLLGLLLRNIKHLRLVLILFLTV
jgi:hypothetical protein